MNLWFAPQISEHCPNINPGRFEENLTWFSRPGVASIFTPNVGIVHEWITSAAVTIIRTRDSNGTTIRLSTSNKRKSVFLSSFIGFI